MIDPILPPSFRHPSAPTGNETKVMRAQQKLAKQQMPSSSAFLQPLPLPLPKKPPYPNRPLLQCRRPPTAAVSRRMVHAYRHPNEKEKHTNYEKLHPVLEILKTRLENGSMPGRRTDSRKVALCIEGGGMRGAVSAGMVAAIKYCGLENTFDTIYGSSAGSIVGAYFVSRQLPIYGARIYYDTICCVPEDGRRFIDLWALRHHPYLRVGRRQGAGYYGEGARPVLLLDLLIDRVMREQCPLDWDAFWRYHSRQPLKPVASSLNAMRATTLDHFRTLDEFLECLRASARVPGIAGNPVEIDGEFYADGLLFEPIPYRSALRDGCTDVLVLRTKPESSPLKGTKPGIFEKHIAMPYFDMFHKFAPRAKASDYLSTGSHRYVYNEDLRRLRQENIDPQSSGSSALFSITPPLDAPIVGQLESRAKVVYEGVRSGFAAAYDALSPFSNPDLNSVEQRVVRTARGDDKTQRITAGYRAARWVFSDAEFEGVEKRHNEARQARIEFRRRKGKVRQVVRGDKRKLRRAIRKRRARRARARARARRDEEDLVTIEERFFVG